MAGAEPRNSRLEGCNATRSIGRPPGDSSTWCSLPLASPFRCLVAPNVSVGLESIPLHLDDAEALPCRSFHHPPALHLRDATGTKLLESRDLGREIIRLDVDVHPARVIDGLHQYLYFARWSVQPPVVRVLGITKTRRRPAKRFCPELGSRIEVVGPTIDDDGRSDNR